MFKLLCVCIFVAQYATCLSDDDFKHFYQRKNGTSVPSTTTIKPPKQLNANHEDLLPKWKAFMVYVRMHGKSLNTMPEDLRSGILDMKSPKEFVRLIIRGMEQPISAPIPEPSEDTLDAWEMFKDSLEEKLPVHEAIDVVMLHPFVMEYIRNISPNENYRHEVNNIFQIDPYLNLELNLFRNKMRKDYNVSISSLPLNIIKSLLYKFFDVKEGFISIMSSEFGNHDIKLEDGYAFEDLMRYWILWYDSFGPSEPQIHPILITIVRFLTNGTILEPKIDEVFKLHDSNRLISKTEKLWKKTKEENEAHDGVEVFVKFLKELGNYYNETEELCDHRFLLVAAVLSMKNGFASKSKCTYKDLLEKASRLQDPKTPQGLDDYMYHLAQLKNNQTTQLEISENDTPVLQIWKTLVNAMRLRQASLMTMPEIIKDYILKMTSPKEFVNLIFDGLGVNKSIREPRSDELDSWGLFKTSLKEALSPKDHQIDNIVIDPTLMKYIRNASDSVIYKQEVNNLFQIDPLLRAELDMFRNTMRKHYNVSISSLPMDIVKSLFVKFADPVEGFTAIISSFPGNHQLKTHGDFKDAGLLWASLIDTFSPAQKDISPRVMFLMKYIIKDSFLEPKFDEVLKLHESNRLVSKIEKLWMKTKEESEVHDGLKVFVQFSEELGIMYGNTEELCDERLKIMEALDKLKDGFSSKSTCTYTRLLQNKNE